MNFLNKISLKLRLTLLFVLIFSGSLAIFSTFLYLERRDNRLAEFDASLYNYAIDIAESLDIDSYGEVEFDPSIIKINEKIFPFALGRSYITVMDINGKTVAHSQNQDRSLPETLNDASLDHVLKKGVSYTTVTSENGVYFRVINYLLPVLKIDSPLILHISVPLTRVEQGNSALKRILIMAQGVILIFSGIAGYLFMGRVLLPIVEITNKAKQIEVKNLNERVPVPESIDEVHDLAETINHLFERLNLAFEFQERFVQDASHQLKTPLAIIKGELDLFKSGVRKETEITSFLNTMSSEIESLIKLTNNLLILARVDSGEKNLSLAEFSIEEIILSQVSRLSRLATSKSISLNINLDAIENLDEQDLTIYADHDLIAILIYNYIENAIKYSPAQSVVSIKCEVANNEVYVSVTDSGPGIKSGQEQKIFDRFFRSENTIGESGSGLGLAICNSVAKLHNAFIWAQNNESKGATFYFKIKNIKAGIV